MNDTKWGTGEPSGNGNCVSLSGTMKTVNGDRIPTLDDQKCRTKKPVVCSCKTGEFREPVRGLPFV